MSRHDKSNLEARMKGLIGGIIIEAGVRSDEDGGDWPTLTVKCGDEVFELEVSQDWEGNGPGVIFGLPTASARTTLPERPKTTLRDGLRERLAALRREEAGQWPNVTERGPPVSWEVPRPTRTQFPFASGDILRYTNGRVSKEGVWYRRSDDHVWLLMTSISKGCSFYRGYDPSEWERIVDPSPALRNLARHLLAPEFNPGDEIRVEQTGETGTVVGHRRGSRVRVTCEKKELLIDPWELSLIARAKQATAPSRSVADFKPGDVVQFTFRRRLTVGVVAGGRGKVTVRVESPQAGWRISPAHLTLCDPAQHPDLVRWWTVKRGQGN